MADNKVEDHHYTYECYKNDEDDDASSCFDGSMVSSNDATSQDTHEYVYEDEDDVEEDGVEEDGEEYRARSDQILRMMEQNSSPVSPPAAAALFDGDDDYDYPKAKAQEKDDDGYYSKGREKMDQPLGSTTSSICCPHCQQEEHAPVLDCHVVATWLGMRHYDCNILLPPDILLGCSLRFIRLAAQRFDISVQGAGILCRIHGWDLDRIYQSRNAREYDVHYNNRRQQQQQQQQGGVLTLGMIREQDQLDAIQQQQQQQQQGADNNNVPTTLLKGQDAEVQLFSCSICLEDDWTAADMMSMAGCGHAFCRDCWRGHLQAMLDNDTHHNNAAGAGWAQQTCPDQACQRVVTEVQIHELLAGDAHDDDAAEEQDRRLLSRFYQLQLQSFVRANPETLRWCPGPDCDFIAVQPRPNLFEAGAAAHHPNTKQAYHCRHCHARFCFDCGELPHDGPCANTAPPAAAAATTTTTTAATATTTTAATAPAAAAAPATTRVATSATTANTASTTKPAPDAPVTTTTTSTSSTSSTTNGTAIGSAAVAATLAPPATTTTTTTTTHAILDDDDTDDIQHNGGGDRNQKIYRGDLPAPACAAAVLVASKRRQQQQQGDTDEAVRTSGVNRMMVAHKKQTSLSQSMGPHSAALGDKNPPSQNNNASRRDNHGDSTTTTTDQPPPPQPGKKVPASVITVAAGADASSSPSWAKKLPPPPPAAAVLEISDDAPARAVAVPFFQQEEGGGGGGSMIHTMSRRKVPPVHAAAAATAGIGPEQQAKIDPLRQLLQPPPLQPPPTIHHHQQVLQQQQQRAMRTMMHQQSRQMAARIATATASMNAATAAMRQLHPPPQQPATVVNNGGTNNSNNNKNKPIKQCPNCRVDIEKIGGCNRMVCKICQHPFCWHCLAEYVSYGSHFCGGTPDYYHGGGGRHGDDPRRRRRRRIIEPVPINLTFVQHTLREVLYGDDGVERDTNNNAGDLDDTLFLHVTAAADDPPPPLPPTPAAAAAATPATVIDRADAEKVDLQLKELERYAHCYNRFHAHEQGQRFCENQQQCQQTCLQGRADHYTRMAGIQTGADVDFLTQANETLLASRRMLKYTYCSVYHDPASSLSSTTSSSQKQQQQQQQQNVEKKNLVSEMKKIAELRYFHLEQLERYTEELSELSENALSRQDRQRVLTLIKTVCQCMGAVADFERDWGRTSKQSK